MFGIPSLAKLAVLAVLLFVGWNLVKWFQKFASNSKKRDEKIIEAETCEKCGLYIAAGTAVPDCKKPDCPYR